MAAGKKKSARRTQHDLDKVEVLGIKKAADLGPRRRFKSSKYDEILDKVLQLKPGQVLEIDISKMSDQLKARNSISAAVRRMAQPYTNYTLKIKMTANDTVGIYCYENEDDEP